MYRNQKRKSGRVNPYEIASSSTSNRRSVQFVSPIVDYDLSYSSIKSKNERTSLPNQTNLTISVSNDNKFENSSESNLNQQVNSNEKLDLSEQLKLKNSNDNMNEQIDQNKPIDNIQSNDNCTINNQNVKEPNIIESTKSIGKSQEEYDAQFDSEFDNMFLNSSVNEKLKEQLELSDRQQFNVSNSKTEQSEDETYLTNEQDDELFDSDAINNTDCESLNINDDEDDTCDNLFTYQNVHLENNDPIDNALNLKSNNNENDHKLNNEADIFDPFGVDKEIDDDDGIDLELDQTLIFKADDPIMSQYIIQPSQHIPTKDDGFKTASGLPIKIKMTLEQQRRRASRLGIILNNVNGQVE